MAAQLPAERDDDRAQCLAVGASVMVRTPSSDGASQALSRLRSNQRRKSQEDIWVRQAWR